MRRAIKKAESSIPRGDARTYPLQVPTSMWEAGTKLFFAMKTVVDDDPLDTEAVVKKTFVDADIVATDDDFVHYQLVFAPADTFDLEVAVYRAEIQVVIPGALPTTFPDPGVQEWDFAVTGDVNRRTE